MKKIGGWENLADPLPPELLRQWMRDIGMKIGNG